MSVWLIRCGHRGAEEHKEKFFTQNRVTLGYGLTRPVTDFDTRDALKNCADLRDRSAVGQDAGKLWRFAGRNPDSDNCLRAGDLLLTPYHDAAGRPLFAIGSITGNYRFQDDGDRHPHCRSVNWLRRDIPITDQLPIPVRQFLDRRSGFTRALQFDEAELQPLLPENASD